MASSSKEQKATGALEKLQIVNTGMGDPLSLQTSDHPGMSLVSALLVGSNFRSWSRTVRIALGVKMKLGFVEGTTSIPSKDTEGYEQWKRCDFMVTSWILNSISKELVDGFIYTASARDLWQEICERFGECNGPMIYELHRKISLISQENQSVSVYFTKLKRLWDELRSVEPLPTCTCGASRAIAEITNRNRLMQFLMGLNKAFASVRDQVLGMDHLPTVNKAYSMVVKFESQREILGAMNDNSESLALLNKAQAQSLSRPRRSKVKKGHCTFCNMDGHTREGYFRLIGYPDWFKAKNKIRTQSFKGNRSTKVMAVVEGNKSEEDNPLEYLDPLSKIHELTSMLSSLKQEVSQLVKGKGTFAPSTSHGPEAHFIDFADGKTQVTQSRKLNLFGKLILDDVLYIPHFQYNLISVGQLMSSHGYYIVMWKDYCLIQDPLNKKVVAIGKKQRGLFRLNQMSFSHSDVRNCLFEIMNSNADLHSFVNSTPFQMDLNKEHSMQLEQTHKHVVNMNDMHDRLGHASVENQFNTTIKVIRSDNGKEFLSHNYGSLLMSKGIKH
ncbi:uncharacterized protein LOC110604958 [Manihot esculenta]|uniref:uncharacterized protein LOC110604958 n=1 Tax=Manihot esculenta TaxID=3983 RepID=UPI000B5D329B|nr:uncharacterized protein LOC110604958 [Manihot esculenta]